MNAFITGSRRYGTPRPDSDIDLVVLVDAETFGVLFTHGHTETGTIRFGDLNLILLTDSEKYEAWKKTTEHLACQPFRVTREQAIAALEAAGATQYRVGQAGSPA